MDLPREIHTLIIEQIPDFDTWKNAYFVDKYWYNIVKQYEWKKLFQFTKWNQQHMRFELAHNIPHGVADHIESNELSESDIQLSIGGIITDAYNLEDTQCSKYAFQPEKEKIFVRSKCIGCNEFGWFYGCVLKSIYPWCRYIYALVLRDIEIVYEPNIINYVQLVFDKVSGLLLYISIKSGGIRKWVYISYVAPNESGVDGISITIS